jgi:hypothetical protein
MRHAIALFLVLTLGACDQPSPHLWGAQGTRAQAGGYAVTVWRRGDRVEVIRHGYAPRADQPALRPAMAQAIVDVTGCAVRPNSLEGDTGVLRAAIDCD